MELKVAIAGLGTIGKVVASRILKGIPGLTLTAVATRRKESARVFLKEHGSECDVQILPLKELAAVADVIVECLPSSAFDELAEPSLRCGRSLVVVSVGALIARPHLFELAKTHGGRIIVPTGALIGLDAVQAAALGEIYSVRMITRKPPSGLVGAPYLLEHNIDLEGLAEPLKVYE